METQQKGIGQIVLRLALGVGFLMPVADRVGLLGAPGSGSANWGDWKHFTDYTHTLMPILPKGVTDVFGLLATILEVIFGVNLIIGFKTSLNAMGGALLTLTFALSMIATQGIAAPFKYPVFVFVGAGLVLAGLHRYRWSIDEILNNKDH